MRAFLSYSQANSEQAALLTARLDREADIELTSQAMDMPQEGGPATFMERVREHDAVLHIISLPFLKSRDCMRELLALMKDDVDRDYYLEHTVPLLIDDRRGELFSDIGQLRLVNYWMGQKSTLEDQINARSKEFGPAIDELRTNLADLRDITEHVRRFMQTAKDNVYAVHYRDQQATSFADVIRCLREIEMASRDGVIQPELDLQGTPAHAMAVSRSVSPQPLASPLEVPSSAPSSNDVALEEVKQLIRLRDSIVIASESDPNLPEFPPFSPRFPATPAERHYIERLNRAIIIKDESHNFTGSHKDRMAWEIVVYYKKLIQDLLAPHSKKTPKLPSASIISNGSAAVAIQLMLRCYGLPPLKVLVDFHIDTSIKRKLRSIGCEVHEHNLSKQVLGSSDVLELTDNKDGFDITARDLIDPNTRTYYDWLAYEILNCGAKHIFIPVGTGDLFVNVLTVLQDERLGVANDKRLLGGSETIEGLTLYGATSSDYKTKMYKLYAPHRPTLGEARRLVAEMRDAKHCGKNSKIYDVKESVVPDAMQIASGLKIHCDESGIAGLSLLLQLNEKLDIADDEDILVVNTGWLPAV